MAHVKVEARRRNAPGRIHSAACDAGAVGGSPPVAFKSSLASAAGSFASKSSLTSADDHGVGGFRRDGE